MNLAVRIYEGQDRASGVRGASVTGGGNRSLHDWDHATAAGRRDLSRAIRGSVIRHDHFDGVSSERITRSCDINGIEQPWQERFFVVRRNNER